MPGAGRAADYFVNPGGASGAYPTVQAAVDAVNGQSEWNRANVFIAPGVYREEVTVAKPYLSLIGQGSSATATTITFDGTHTFGAEWGEVMGITSTATAFMARNITVENSIPDRNRDAALAVRCSADRAIFEEVRVLGYQDTLLVDTASRQYFRNSFISGDTDFIFGDADGGVRSLHDRKHRQRLHYRREHAQSDRKRPDLSRLDSYSRT